ncbi:MAG: DnaJ domain-containing protein [Archangium sp.]|nr:DnaJ domain-containing protein [Archangium sp.]
MSRSKEKTPVTGLSRGVFALAKTKRKRFLWCAWWTGEPTASPFRPPDAWGGGAFTREEAQALAERAAARPLSPVDDHWAGAWKRSLAGLAPFPKHTGRVPRASGSPPLSINPFEVLGLTGEATLDEVKLAFRKKALEHHPDQGGTTEAFLEVRRAWESIVKRRSRRPRG